MLVHYRYYPELYPTVNMMQELEGYHFTVEMGRQTARNNMCQNTFGFR